MTNTSSNLCTLWLHHLWHTSTATCFGTTVPSSGSYYTKAYKPTCQSRFCSSLQGIIKILKCQNT